MLFSNWFIEKKYSTDEPMKYINEKLRPEVVSKTVFLIVLPPAMYQNMIPDPGIFMTAKEAEDFCKLFPPNVAQVVPVRVGSMRTTGMLKKRKQNGRKLFIY
jgi:hypothetical protein